MNRYFVQPNQDGSFSLVEEYGPNAFYEVRRSNDRGELEAQVNSITGAYGQSATTGTTNTGGANDKKGPAGTTDSALAAILAGLNLGKSFNQAGGIGQLDPYNAALQQEYLRQRLTQLEIPMSQAEQANLIAKITGYWPGLGGGGTAMTDSQAIDAIAKNRDDKFWNFYRANGWKTDTPEQKQAIVQKWIASGDPRWKGKSAVQVAQDLGLGGSTAGKVPTFEREQWLASEQGRKFTQDLANRQFAAQQQSSAAQRRERMAELTGLYYQDEPGYAEPTGGRWNQPRREPAYAALTQDGFQRDINRMPLDPNMPAGPRPTGFTVDTPAQSNQLAVTFAGGRGLNSDAVADTLARLGVRATQTGPGGATLELPQGREAEITEAIRRAGIFGSVGNGGNSQFAAPTGDNPLLPGTQGGYWAEGTAPATKSNVWGLPQDFKWADYQRGLDDWAFRFNKEHGEWPSDNDWERRIQGTMEEQGIDAPKGFRDQLLNTMLENNKARGTMFPGTLEVDRTPAGQPRKNPGPGGVPWTMRAYDAWAQRQPGYAAPSGNEGAFPYPTELPQSNAPEPDWRNVRAMPEPRGDAPPPPPFAGDREMVYTGGSADFDESTGTYRSTGTPYPPSTSPDRWNQSSSFTRGQPIETLEKQRMRQQGQQFLAQLLGSLSGPRDWVKYQAVQPQSSFGTVKAQPSYEGAFADFWNGGGRAGMPMQASDSAGNAIPAEVLQPGKLKPQDLNAFEASPTKKAMQEGLWSAQGLDPNDMWARARAVQPTGQANPNTWWR